MWGCSHVHRVRGGTIPLTGFYFFFGGGGGGGALICIVWAHSEREDFAKGAWRNNYIRPNSHF